MEYELKYNKTDIDMIEAYFVFKSPSNKIYKYLAFIIHTDHIDDPEIKEEITNQGSASVEMKLINVL